MKEKIAHLIGTVGDNLLITWLFLFMIYHSLKGDWHLFLLATIAAGVWCISTKVADAITIIIVKKERP